MVSACLPTQTTESIASDSQSKIYGNSDNSIPRVPAPGKPEWTFIITSLTLRSGGILVYKKYRLPFGLATKLLGMA